MTCPVPASTLLASWTTLSSNSVSTVEVSLHFNDLTEKHFYMFPCLLSTCVQQPFRQELSSHNSGLLTVLFREAGLEFVSYGELIV